MKTSEILDLDYKKNSKLFQKILRKIPEFYKWVEGETIPFVSLEETLFCYMTTHDNLRLLYIKPIYIPGERTIYNASVIDNTVGLQTKSIAAGSMYEMFAKLLIYVYAELKKSQKI